MLKNTELQELSEFGRYLIVCSSQAGTSEETFSPERLQKEVLEPLQRLLDSDSVDFIVLTSPMNQKCCGYEGHQLRPLDDGPPYFMASNTVLAALKCWNNTRYLGRLIYVHDGVSESPEELIKEAKKRVPTSAQLVHCIGIGESVSVRL
jgi:hypothetical protein